MKYEDFSEEMQELVDTYSEIHMGYKELSKFQEEAEKLGYTFDFYIDAIPYNFRLLKDEVKDEDKDGQSRVH